MLGAGLTPIARGALVGVGLSFATGRLLAEQLYGVKPDDPLTFAAVLATFLAVAIVATLLPARRAMRVTPARALGAE